MAVTVLTVEREVVPGDQARIKELLRELRSHATRQPGFISGQTVIDAFNPCVFMTISTWSSIGAWQSWEKNPERAPIIESVDELLQGKPRARLWLHDEEAPDAGV